MSAPAAPERERARAAFEASGFPRARREDWRFTPHEALTAPDYSPAGAPASPPRAGAALCPFGQHQLAFANGFHNPDRSVLRGLPAGVEVRPLSEALEDGEAALRQACDRFPEGLPLAARAAASWRDGALVRLRAGARLDRPLRLLWESGDGPSRGPARADVRVLVLLEAGASLDLVEEWVDGGEAPFWTNSLAAVSLGEGARLRHFRLLREAAQARRTSALEAEVGRGARYESRVFSFGGAFLREDLRVRLAGEGAECALEGLALTRGREVADHHTRVEHAVPGTAVRQLYKSVLDGESRSVFEGLVRVLPGAQKSEASVYAKSLLLSERASSHANPEFKILADDVSCRHGGAAGRLSGEALFYLRSRGVGEAEARRLLVYAFGSEMVSRVEPEALREALEAALHARMPESEEGR